MSRISHLYSQKNTIDQKIREMKQIIYSLVFLSFLIVPPVQGRNTPNFYKCFNKVGGSWVEYGRLPNGCNANSYGEDSVILRNYPMTIFDDNVSRNLETIRYMEELHAIVRDSAKYYIKKRKPNVSVDELEAYALAIVTTAAHETKVSHYRRASDNRIKLMRGDSGHGHGMMQMDDRWHFPAIENGIAWNLISHITYSMDIYYDRWQNAVGSSCVGAATNFTSRTRAAWAAYNGQPTAFCRWKTAPTDGDKNFFAMLRDKGWQTYVKEVKPSASIDVACLMEHPETCPLPGSATTLTEGVLYKIPNGNYCSLDETTLHCVVDYRDTICLNAINEVDIKEATTIDKKLADQAKQVVEDRHVLCKTYDPSIFEVGDFIEGQKNVFVRQTPGGGRAGILLRGDVSEVIDFELRDPSENNRYYKIRMGNLTGFIFSGNKTDHATWMKISTESDSHPSTIARVGDDIKVKNAVGINMRATPEGTFQVNVPVNTRLKVQEMVSRGSFNSIYYKVTYTSKTGYIYAGKLQPTDTTADWVIRVREF
jgi:hypothetical protein